MSPTSAFVATHPTLLSRPCQPIAASIELVRPSATAVCSSCSRRAVLSFGASALFGAAVLGAAGAAGAADATDAPPGPGEKRGRGWKRPGEAAEDDDVKCKNCQGGGMVPCDLCSGTGFWRALASSDKNQKYQGVVCPECEGAGTLRCPVCLGTGDGNVKGLLRRRRVEAGPGRILQTNFPEEEGGKK